MNTSVTKQLTRQQFNDIVSNDKIDYYETTQRDVYRIKLENSFLKCLIQKTEHGVQIVWLDSSYEKIEHRIKLLMFAGFHIAYKINNNRGFETIEINDNGDIISIQK